LGSSSTMIRRAKFEGGLMRRRSSSHRQQASGAGSRVAKVVSGAGSLLARPTPLIWRGKRSRSRPVGTGQGRYSFSAEGHSTPSARSTGPLTGDGVNLSSVVLFQSFAGQTPYELCGGNHCQITPDRSSASCQRAKSMAVPEAIFLIDTGALQSPSTPTSQKSLVCRNLAGIAAGSRTGPASFLIDKMSKAP
jgi:hypothetical protein